MLSQSIADRPQSRGEEIANTLSHGAGLIAALFGAPFLVAAMVQQGNVAVVVGVTVYAITMVILYLASTLYHALPVSRAKGTLLVCDHAAIFLFIAGTYTPFTLGVLHGGWGWIIFGLVWALAATGVALKLMGGAVRYKTLSLIMYLGMGWLFLMVVKPIWQIMPSAGLLWLFAGGMAYTLGVGFFVSGRKYHHFIWHLFVLTGSVCHFIAILKYAS
jgi:hemolysin III